MNKLSSLNPEGYKTIKKAGRDFEKQIHLTGHFFLAEMNKFFSQGGISPAQGYSLLYGKTALQSLPKIRKSTLDVVLRITEDNWEVPDLVDVRHIVLSSAVKRNILKKASDISTAMVQKYLDLYSKTISKYAREFFLETSYPAEDMVGYFCVDLLNALMLQPTWWVSHVTMHRLGNLFSAVFQKRIPCDFSEECRFETCSK